MNRRRIAWAAAAVATFALTAAATVAVLIGSGGASVPDKIDVGTHACTTDAAGYCPNQP